LIGQYSIIPRINIVSKEKLFMSARDLEQLRERLQNIHLESEALRLEEEALLARIAIVERQVQPRVRNDPIPRPLAIGDRVRILNPGTDRRQPRDIGNFTIRRAPHNVERIERDNRVRVDL
jgi:hypothetical protein